MQEIHGNVDNQKFEIEIALEQQRGAQLLPFPGMDSTYTLLLSCIIASIERGYFFSRPRIIETLVNLFIH